MTKPMNGAMQAMSWNDQQSQNLDKVGGWLLLYCLFAVVYIPLESLIGVIGMLLFGAPLWIGLPCLAPNALQVVAGILLLERDPEGLRWIRWSIYGYFVFAVLTSVVACFKLNAMQAAGYMFSMVLGAVQPIICWLYFQKSKRVRAVYGRVMVPLLKARGAQA